MSVLPRAKRWAREVLYRSGAFGLYHRVRNGRTLTVLMFHRVLPSGDPAWQHAEREFAFTLEGFRQVLDFVQRHYHVVGYGAVRKALRGEGGLPSRPLLITFDDGWRDTVQHAMPELHRRQLPALLFVASEAVGQNADRWWQDALVQAMAMPDGKAKLFELAGWPTVQAGQAGAEQRLSGWMAGLPPAQRQAAVEAAVPGAWAAVAQRQMITQADIEQWLQAGFDVGGHGHSHAPLTQASDPGTDLQHSFEWVGGLPRFTLSMSFPHGAVNPQLVQAARSTGFETLFSSAAELVPLHGYPPVALGRIHVPENEWTCEAGRVSAARLATYLFPRPVASSRMGADASA